VEHVYLSAYTAKKKALDRRMFMTVLHFEDLILTQRITSENGCAIIGTLKFKFAIMTVSKQCCFKSIHSLS